MRKNIFRRIKEFFIGKARNPLDQSVFHNISLIAFFAWVGLGADGISSSCYGPAEAFINLGKYHYLGLLVALATAITIFIISESYSQIIELFPTGGGGYIVASKLLGPRIGMVSGSALLIDYILTITISIASGADAVFSFLPAAWLGYKLWFALLAVIFMIVLNLRGVKESVTVLMPIFMAFILTHVFIILYAILSHVLNLPMVISATAADIQESTANLGLFGMLFLMMRAFSLGAGTFTGIEAVSNNLSILREPKVKTAKQTMRYMVISLASIVLGLMFAYAFFGIEPQHGKTLNAILFERVAGGWGDWGYLFILLTLISEAAILFVAAQTGFLGGPSVLANMAADRWIPKRFALLSDRLVTMNGILIMGVGAIMVMVGTNGSVGLLVVFYSINVFITFCLSQLGMVRHWWQVRKNEGKWLGKFAINGIGLILTTFILISVSVMKFHEGGWVTLFITGIVVSFALIIKSNYERTDRLVRKLDSIVTEVESTQPVPQIPVRPKGEAFNQLDKTAIILVKDFTGAGLKTIFNIFPSFGNDIKNFVFVQVGLIDAGAFRGTDELERVKKKVDIELNRYVTLMKRHGYHAEGHALFGIDTGEEIEKFSIEIMRRFPKATFFGGQIVFEKSSIISRLLHNYTLFSVQKELYKRGLRLYVLPIELIHLTH
jgi:amino acid transporter